MSGHTLKSPYRVKPAWKSKSRNTSVKKKKPRTISNKISKSRKRKFSNSDEDFMDPGELAKPKTPRVPHNTLTDDFNSKRKNKIQTRSRNQSRASRETKNRSPNKRRRPSRLNRKEAD